MAQGDTVGRGCGPHRPRFQSSLPHCGLCSWETFLMTSGVSDETGEDPRPRFVGVRDGPQF